MQTINPVLVLVGAAASVGCSMFARSLLTADTGSASAQRYIDERPHWAGIDLVSVGMIIDRELKKGQLYVPPTEDIE